MEYYYTWDEFNKGYLDYEVNDWEDVEKLPDSARQEWDEWLYKKISHGSYESIGIHPSEIPSWAIMEYESLVKNQWLVHQTNNARDIVNSGFIHGVDDLRRLGYTTHMGDIDKEYGGYNFAYHMDDVDRFGSDRGSQKYGDEAVFFRASGVKIMHYGDLENQVIFYGKTATSRIAAYQNGGEWDLISSKTGEVLVTKETLGELGEWISKNEAQYINHFKK